MSITEFYESLEGFKKTEEPLWYPGITITDLLEEANAANEFVYEDGRDYYEDIDYLIGLLNTAELIQTSGVTENEAFSTEKTLLQGRYETTIYKDLVDNFFSVVDRKLDSIKELDDPQVNKFLYLQTLFTLAHLFILPISNVVTKYPGISESSKILIHNNIGAEPGDVVLCDLARLDYLVYALAYGDTNVTYRLIRPSQVDIARYAIFSEFILRGIDGVVENLEVPHWGSPFDDNPLREMSWFLDDLRDRPFRQLRNCFNTTESLTALQENDEYWCLSQSRGAEQSRSVVYLEDYEDLSDRLTGRDKGMELFDDTWLKEVLELHEDTGVFLMIWDGGFQQDIKMTVVNESDDSSSSSKESILNESASCSVSRTTIFINGRNFTPSYYLSGYIEHKEVYLSDVVTEIRRGTTMSKKDFESLIIGSTSRSEVITSPTNKGTVLTTHYALRENDRYLFIDNSNIESQDKVIPTALSELPEKQQRFTVLPEDGEVLLVPRSGEFVARYFPYVPTLISNNIFIVKVNKELIDFDYLYYYLNSALTRKDMRLLDKPLSKHSLQSIGIPVVSKERQESTCVYAKAIDEKIREMKNEIGFLNRIERFNPSEGLEPK